MLAGYFAGDGSWESAALRGYLKQSSYFPKATQIAMRMQFGGRIHGPYNYNTHANSKPIWKCDLNNEDDNADARIRVLEAVKKYAPLKVQEAIIGLETQVQGSAYTRGEQTTLANWKTEEGKYHPYEGS